MFFVNPAMVNLGVPSAAVTAIVGYAVVFLGIALLLVVVLALGKVMSRKKAAAPAAQEAPAPAEAAPAAPAGPLAPGTAGEIKRYNVSDREAAMIIAIVANKLGRPLNELRFKSIKEVKEDEV